MIAWTELSRLNTVEVDDDAPLPAKEVAAFAEVISELRVPPIIADRFIQAAVDATKET